MDTKPLTRIVEYVRQEETEAELKRASRQLCQSIERVYAQVGSHIEEISALARKHGMSHLLAELPPEIAATVQGVLSGIKGSWESLSPQPFPPTPDEPSPPPEVPNKVENP
jgi:hypothetical protein